MTRLLGLLGGLSLTMDMGTGAPLEESLRRCVVAVRLARATGRSDDEVRDVLYAGLLEHLGLHGIHLRARAGVRRRHLDVPAGFLATRPSPATYDDIRPEVSRRLADPGPG